MADGETDECKSSGKLSVRQWKVGQTFAYVIDILDKDKNIIFRIHYADAASEPEGGYLPQGLQDQKKPIDLSILSLGGFDKVDNYPEGIVENLKPKFVLVGHWEDFFANQEQEEQYFVRAIDADEFFQRFQQGLNKETSWTMPMLYHTQYFAPHGKFMTPNQP